MRGSTCVHPSGTDWMPPHRGERVAFALLAIAALGAVIPIGPAMPADQATAVAAACPGPALRWRDGPDTRCAVPDQVAMAAPTAAPRMAAMLMP